MSTVACCSEHREEQDTGVDKPLLGRNEAAGHSKACEAGLVGILAALSRATEALPLSQREAYIGAPDQAALLCSCCVWCLYWLIISVPNQPASLCSCCVLWLHRLSTDSLSCSCVL